MKKIPETLPNTMSMESIVISNKYILIPTGNEYTVVDTGSPLSYHESGQLSFGGTIHDCQTSIVGVDGDRLSGEVGLPVAGLLGMDIINKHNSVCFDYGNARIIVDDDRLEESDITPLPSGRIMNTPYIDISIEGRRARVFVDTGAPISYISNSYTNGLASINRLHDYNPAFGDFMTDIFEVNVNIGTDTHVMHLGNLPALIQMSLGLVQVDGIIGYELFSRYAVLYRDGEWFVCRNT